MSVRGFYKVSIVIPSPSLVRLCLCPAAKLRLYRRVTLIWLQGTGWRQVDSRYRSPSV